MRTFSLLGAHGTELVIDIADLCYSKLARNQLSRALSTKLRELLPHEGFAYGLADLALGSVLTHENVSIPHQYFKAATNSHGMVCCPLVTRWTRKRRPVWYEQPKHKGPPARCQQDEAFHDLFLRRIVLHGVPISPSAGGWYAFSGLEDHRRARADALLRLITPHLHTAFGSAAPNRKSAAGVEMLSLRERGILRFLSQGKTNEQIAVLCHISPLTVKTHVQHILLKLGVLNRAHAVATAVRMGLIDLRDAVL